MQLCFEIYSFFGYCHRSHGIICHVCLLNSFVGFLLTHLIRINYRCHKKQGLKNELRKNCFQLTLLYKRQKYIYMPIYIYFVPL